MPFLDGGLSVGMDQSFEIASICCCLLLIQQGTMVNTRAEACMGKVFVGDIGNQLSDFENGRVEALAVFILGLGYLIEVAGFVGEAFCFQHSG